MFARSCKHSIKSKFRRHGWGLNVRLPFVPERERPIATTSRRWSLMYSTGRVDRWRHNMADERTDEATGDGAGLARSLCGAARLLGDVKALATSINRCCRPRGKARPTAGPGWFSLPCAGDNDGRHDRSSIQIADQRTTWPTDTHPIQPNLSRPTSRPYVAGGLYTVDARCIQNVWKGAKNEV